MIFYAFSKFLQNHHKTVIMTLLIWVNDIAVRPLRFFKLLPEAPDENSSRGSSGFRRFRPGTACWRWGKVVAEHLHHEAHLTVPSAWPEAPRGGVATRSSGLRPHGEVMGPLQRPSARASMCTRWSTMLRRRWCSLWDAREPRVRGTAAATRSSTRPWWWRRAAWGREQRGRALRVRTSGEHQAAARCPQHAKRRQGTWQGGESARLAWLPRPGRASPIEAFYQTRGGWRRGRRGTHFWARYGPNWILGPKEKLYPT
jgi:hypothetical protein